MRWIPFKQVNGIIFPYHCTGPRKTQYKGLIVLSNNTKMSFVVQTSLTPLEALLDGIAASWPEYTNWMHLVRRWMCKHLQELQVSCVFNKASCKTNIWCQVVLSFWYVCLSTWLYSARKVSILTPTVKRNSKQNLHPFRYPTSSVVFPKATLSLTVV